MISLLWFRTIGDFLCVEITEVAEELILGSDHSAFAVREKNITGHGECRLTYIGDGGIIKKTLYGVSRSAKMTAENYSSYPLTPAQKNIAEMQVF